MWYMGEFDGEIPCASKLNEWRECDSDLQNQGPGQESWWLCSIIFPQTLLVA